MTDPTAGDPFATPPRGRPAEPVSPQATPAPPPPGYSATPPPPGYSAPQPGYPAAPQAYPPGPDGYYPYGYPPQRKPKTWMNIVALSAVGGGLIIPLLANIAGIVFGHLGRRAAKRGEADYAGVGLAGLILNYIAVVLWILAIIAYIVFVVWAINECATNPYGDFCSGSSYD